MYFQYRDTETTYLAKKDKRLAWAIERIGHIDRPVDEAGNLFSAVVHHILGQQISTKAQQTLWQRLQDKVGDVTPDALLSLGRDELQKIGTTYKKTDYILDFCQKVQEGSFDLKAIRNQSDEEIIRALSSLKGIGVWTAEMLLTFCLQRPDVISYGDLAILRGMRMLYRHREIDRKKFDRYKKRYSPYATVASLYLWAIAGGAIPELTDPKNQGKGKREADH